MVWNKYKIYLLALLFAVVSGCAMTSEKDNLLRSGYADLDTGNLKAADKKARRILRDWNNDHSASLLLAASAARAGKSKKAIDIITQMDYQCKKDMCEDSAHIYALMLLTTLTQDEDILKKSQERIEELKRKITVRQHSNLLDFYVQTKRPQDAASSFEKLMEASGNNLTAEQKMAGFVLFYSLYETEKAKSLWNNQLSPQQKTMVRQTYGEPQF